MRRTLVKSIKR